MANFHPIDIGSRLELLVDEHLIAQLNGGAELRLHKPILREIALTTDQPWEGNACGSFTIFQEGNRYRMYYLGRHFVTAATGLDEKPHPSFVCYAESTDGINWVRARLVRGHARFTRAGTSPTAGPGRRALRQCPD